MTKTDIIQAWKDPSFRECLSEAEYAILPDNPAGLMELPEEVQTHIVAGLAKTFNINCIPTYQIACMTTPRHCPPPPPPQPSSTVNYCGACFP